MAKEMLYQYQGPNGLDIPNAYIRIESFAFVKRDPVLALELSSAGKGTGTKYVACPILSIRQNKNKNKLDEWQSESFVFAYDHTSNVSIIKQAYNFIETLPELVAALEVND